MIKRILYLLTLFFYLSLFGQNQQNFIQLDKTFRLSSKFASDGKSSMWVGDLDGVYRYNGYEFLFYPFEDIFGPDFINKREVILQSDGDQNVWISTRNGKIAYINKEGSITNFPNNSSRVITAISPSRETLWFGSADGAVYTLDKENEKLKALIVLPVYMGRIQGVSSISYSENYAWIKTSENNIYRCDLTGKGLEQIELPFEKKDFDVFYLDTDNLGHFWLATENEGLWYYDIDSSEFSEFIFKNDDFKPKQTRLFRSIFKDSNGIIWLGSDGKGLYRVDPETMKYQTFRKESLNPYSLTANTILEIDEDKNGNIWILPKGGTINILPNNTNNISYFSGSADATPDRVLSILQASNEDIYLGTDGNGLTRIPDSKKPVKIEELNANYIQTIAEDNSGNIWIGSYLNGLHVYNPTTNTSEKITEDMNDALDVRELFIDSKNRIWVGSVAGIRIFNNSKELIAKFNYDTNGLIGNQVDAINEVRDGQVWISTSTGLFRFDEANDISKSAFTAVPYYPEGSRGIYNYLISDIITGKGETIWLKCDSGFIISLNTKTNAYTSYLSNESLKNIEVESFLFDDHNNLWLSSRNGIHKFNPESEKLNSFYRSNGLQGNVFLRRSSFKAKDGKLFFGGTDGASAFYPDELKKISSKPDLYISQIEVLNKKASRIIPEQVSTNSNNVEFLDLKADQSSFSFVFFAVDNLLNPDFTYEYRLIGFDDNWIEANDDRRATYTNIPHGEYTFEVKAWSLMGEGESVLKQISITVAPYWWQTNLAYFIYILVFFGLLYGYYLWNKMRVRLIQEEWALSKEREVYATKMNFFAKMSHEIQTPLTLILAPLSDMMQKASSKDSLLYQRLGLIKNNAEKLSRIATDLTTVRNKTLNKLKLYVSKNDLRRDLKNIAAGFSELANLKNINFVTELPKDSVELWYDPSKLEHVLYNLLSNAFKFTPTGGKIIFRMVYKKNKVNISVIDTGPGISEEDQDSIFEIFYQSKEGKEAQGQGIGLALSKELIDMHAGDIKFNSKTQQGTHFKCSLLYGKQHLENRSNVVFVDKKEAEDRKQNEKISFEKWKPLQDKISGNKQKSSILIVEDNIEMQIFLKDLLGSYYQIQTADNGRIGLEKLNQFTPDLILSDVMMPEVDGVEFSKQILKNKRFKHIPIILLTAKADNASRLIGLKAGAVSYIQKPFDPSEIYVQIENLLRRKENVISNYEIIHSTDAKIDVSNNKDTQFIKKLSAVLQEEIGNADFKLEDLSKKIGMSYSAIFRQCQEITGQTLTEYFRTIKLKKAAGLIVKNNYRISDAAYNIGYSDSKYFSKCFKEEFGMSPSQFKKNVKEEDLIDVIRM